MNDAMQFTKPKEIDWEKKYKKMKKVYMKDVKSLIHFYENEIEESQNDNENGFNESWKVIEDLQNKLKDSSDKIIYLQNQLKESGEIISNLQTQIKENLKYYEENIKAEKDQLL